MSQATDEPAKRRHPTKQPWRLVRLANLQDAALLLLLLAGEQRGARCVLEHFADAFVGLGRALEVLERADLLADVFGLERGCQQAVVPSPQRAGGALPAQESRASAKSCAAPRWSSGRSASPSCSRRG